MTTITFRTFDHLGAWEQRELVGEIYRDAYAAQIATGDPFNTVDAFMERFRLYTGRPGLTLVIGYENNEPVGQTWGWPLTATSGWWSGLTESQPGFADEDGTRTFALSEIMVRQAWTGRGIAHALHDELLRDRQEQRATLLVRPENTTAYSAYKKWGWTKAAELRPGWPSAPLMDVLVLGLPLT